MCRIKTRHGKVIEAVAKAMDCTLDWLSEGIGPAPAWAAAFTAETPANPSSTPSAPACITHAERLSRVETLLEKFLNRLDTLVQPFPADQDDNETICPACHQSVIFGSIDGGQTHLCPNCQSQLRRDPATVTGWRVLRLAKDATGKARITSTPADFTPKTKIPAP